MKKTIRPLSDHVIIKAVKAEEITASGIVLPDTAREEKPEQGEVLAVGPGKLLENGQRAPMSVQPGDRVLFTKYAPDEVEIDGEEVLVVQEEKILGIVEG